MKATDATTEAQGTGWRNGDLSMRPGVLIRRLHQIHTGLFLEMCGHENITPVMYSVLSCLAQNGPLDQTSMAKAVAIDRTNTTDILGRLRKRGLITSRFLATDRRVRITTLTAEGSAVLERVDPLAEVAHSRTLDGLSETERATFIALMAQLTAAHKVT
jgi:DNA-binding MarR family transcriptional regulator